MALPGTPKRRPTLGGQDADTSADRPGGISDTRVTKAKGFELADDWDEGGPLSIGQEWPECVTLNLARTRNSARGRCSQCNRRQQEHPTYSWTHWSKGKR